MSRWKEEAFVLMYQEMHLLSETDTLEQVDLEGTCLKWQFLYRKCD